jgi:hypothetical protein
MSWESILLETAQPVRDLPLQIDALFSQQRETWDRFRQGELALSSMQTRTYTQDGGHIIVQVNPGRRESTLAQVDPVTVSKRPCFLCPENIPKPERGLAFGDLVILPNPSPVVRRHCTIPSREHTPQRLPDRIGDMLELARALGPEMLVFYNGPRCGASAPDHFHFQACNTQGIPLLTHLPQSTPFENFGRRMLIFADKDAGKVAGRLRQALEALSEQSEDDAEPMVNVISVHRDGRNLTILFPRARHRPECYFAKDESRIAISPAALEMAGILVVAEPDHFDRVDQATALAIYQEVSLDEERFAKLIGAVT